MEILKDFNFKTNRSGYIDALTSVFTVIVAIFVSQHFFPGNKVILIWTLFAAAQSSFYRAGMTKLAQVKLGIESGIYALIGITLTVLILIHLWPYYIFAFAVVVFAMYILPRFRPGMVPVNTFLVIYCIAVIMFYLAMQLFDKSNYVTYLHQQTLGFVIGWAITTIIVMILPLAASEIAPRSTDNYFIVRALRVAVAITIALALSKVFHFYNIAWICFAVVIVAQNSLGESMKKAGQRLIGTFFGILAGILLAEYIASMVHLYAFLSLVFLFLGVLVIKKDYRWGLFFVTLLLASIFFIMIEGEITIVNFLVSRFVDTLIGVVVGLVCEMVILPRTYIKHLRVDLNVVYRDIWFITMLLKTPHQRNDRKLLLEDIKTRIKQADALIQDIRYEPLTLLSKRYSKLKTIPRILHKFYSTLNDMAAHDQAISEKCLDYFQATFANFCELSTQPEETNLKKLKQQKALLAPLLASADSAEQKVLKIVNMLLELYIHQYQTPRWILIPS